MSEAQRLLGPLIPEGFSSKGQGKLTFECKGSLSPPDEKPLLSSLSGNGSFLAESITYPGIGVIQNLHSTKLLLKKGILDSTLECQLNNGPCKLGGIFDFNKQEPLANLAIEANEVTISKDLKVLGYIVPILNVPPSGQLSGKGDFSTKASWKGMDWDSQISKTIVGEGKLIVNEGIVKGEDVLSEILKVFGKPSRFQFEQIKTGFILKEGKIFNDNILLNGKDLDFSLQGWTSLVYDPAQKGNPMEYTITGELPEKYIGKDAEEVLSIFGGGKPIVPFVITGTIQKPKVSIKKPGIKDLIQGILESPLL